jgi:hypothetical protein
MEMVAVMVQQSHEGVILVKLNRDVKDKLRGRYRL